MAKDKDEIVDPDDGIEQYDIKVKKSEQNDNMPMTDWGDKETMKSIYRGAVPKNVRYREYR